jgi:uncharacterized repeat protein (TIGR02543 family)
MSPAFKNLTIAKPTHTPYMTSTKKSCLAAWLSKFTLTASSGSGGGLVYQSPVSPFTPGYYASNSTVTLVALPRAGWVFSGWTGSATGLANPLNVLVNSNKVVTATFTSSVPDLIADNTDAGFTTAGLWTFGSSAPGYYGSNYRSLAAGGNPSINATFTPNIVTAGNYDVAGWWPGATDGGTALYSLAYSGGASNQAIIQAAASGTQFYPLYFARPFGSGSGGHLTLSSAAPEAGKTIYADAARWRWSTNQSLIPLVRNITKTGGSATINWFAEMGSVYRVQYKTNLNAASPWVDLSGDVIVSGPTAATIASKTDPSLGNAARRFYRVLLLP